MDPYAPAVHASFAAIRCECDRKINFLQGLVTDGSCDAEDVAEQIGVAEQFAAQARKEVLREWAASPPAVALEAAAVQAAPVLTASKPQPRRKHRRTSIAAHVFFTAG
jgi:hypothetical protein